MAFKFTDENVQEIIASGQPIIIDFWAPWCRPCMNMSPTIDALAEEYQGKVLIGKYNVDEESEIGEKYRIMSIPTLLFFKNGDIVKDIRLAGSQPKGTIEEKIEQLLSL